MMMIKTETGFRFNCYGPSTEKFKCYCAKKRKDDKIKTFYACKNCPINEEHMAQNHVVDRYGSTVPEFFKAGISLMVWDEEYVSSKD